MQTIRNSRTYIRRAFALIIILSVCILISSYGLYYFEKDVQPEVFGTVRSALGYTVLLFTTVGYSDISPLTRGGTIICYVTATVGSLVGIICILGFIYVFIRFTLRDLLKSNHDR